MTDQPTITDAAINAALAAIQRHWDGEEGEGDGVYRSDFADCCVRAGLAAAAPHIVAGLSRPELELLRARANDLESGR